METIKPNPLFSENAVLQRGMSVPVWGTADNGEEVTVTFQDQRVSTIARDGKWMVRLEPLREGGPFTMTVSGKSAVEIKNMLVGEVWLAGGQSNMSWSLGQTDLAEQEIAASADPMFRFTTIQKTQSYEPLDETTIQWHVSDPSTAGSFSGVAYHFGQELRKKLGCPIGIIDNSRGGTRIESWMSSEAVAPFEGEFVHRIAPSTFEVNPHDPSALYNAMVAPLIPYAIRGFIWYQGESNAQNAYLYPKLFPALVADYRKAWGEGDIPFLFVQIAPAGVIDVQPEGSKWAEIREAQLTAAKTISNAAMAVITDHGHPDAHPLHKKAVGDRLSLAARALAYGENIAYKSPYFRSVSIDGSQATVEFDNIDGGLIAKNGDLKGFAMAGEDQVFHVAHATIRGSQVVVSCETVPEPMAVRYGWSDGSVMNLFNAAGLPASPFRTDDFPMRSANECPILQGCSK